MTCVWRPPSHRRDQRETSIIDDALGGHRSQMNRLVLTTIASGARAIAALDSGKCTGLTGWRRFDTARAGYSRQ
jgi:hypothetical protein